jgi:hypothetical protein
VFSMSAAVLLAHRSASCVTVETGNKPVPTKKKETRFHVLCYYLPSATVLLMVLILLKTSQNKRKRREGRRNSYGAVTVSLRPKFRKTRRLSTTLCYDEKSRGYMVGEM